MQQARVILCEKNGTWAVAFRRELASPVIRVYETRSRKQCREEVALSPASFVGLEVTAENIDAAHNFVTCLREEFPCSCVVVLGSRDSEPYEFPLREAGAIFATFSPRHLSAAVTLARRQLMTVSDTGTSLRETIFARLPWSE